MLLRPASLALQGTRALLSLSLLLGAAVWPAQAQRPFRVNDPFYGGENARRAFYDGYAFTTDLSYRGPGGGNDGSQTVGRELFGLSFRLDYQLLRHLDLSGIIDAYGGGSGRTLSLSWVALKYYRTVDNNDYAFRLAVDPSFDGRTGFPQADLAFLSTTLLSPVLSSDYAIGVRRIRRGVEQLVPGRVDDTPSVPEAPTMGELVYSRALGWEVHLMVQYAYLLDVARSNVFMALLVDRGEYTLMETRLRRPTELATAGLSHATALDGEEPQGEAWTHQYRGGVVWLRSGIEYNRPGYQVMPYLSVPVQEWVPAGEDRSARISIGLRLMLR